MGFAFNFSFGVGAGAASILTPTDIFGANLFDWWDFTDTATQSISSGLINSITSKGTNAAVFAASGTERPQSVVGINGLPVADFDGINDFMEVAASTGMYNFFHGGQGAIISVYKTNEPTTAQRTFNNRGGQVIGLDVNSGVVLLVGASSNLVNNVVLNTSPTGIVSSNSQTGISSNDYVSRVDIFDPANATLADRSEIIFNGGTPIKNNSSNATLSNTDAGFNFTLGRRVRLNDQYFNGNLAEAIVVNTKPTTAQLNQIKSYLEYKYGGTFPIV